MQVEVLYANSIENKTYLTLVIVKLGLENVF